MKKLLFMAFLAFVSVQTQSQNVSPRSFNTPREIVEGSNHQSWSTFGAEYLIAFFKDKDSYEQAEATGLALNYTNAFRVKRSIPLYFEWGIGAQYTFMSETGSYGEGLSCLYNELNGWVWTSRKMHKGEKAKVHFVSLKVPLNLIYDFQIPNIRINIDPYVGLRFRGNIWGEETLDCVHDKEEYGSSSNLFNSSEGASKRFQIGWNVGVKARYSNYYIGLGYGSDFTDFAEDVYHLKEASISLGVVF